MQKIMIIEDDPAIRDELALLLENEDYAFVTTKAYEEAEVASQTTIYIFPLFYLALALTVTAASILTIQQLSETEHYGPAGDGRCPEKPVFHLLRHARRSADFDCGSVHPESGSNSGTGGYGRHE